MTPCWYSPVDDGEVYRPTSYGRADPEAQVKAPLHAPAAEPQCWRRSEPRAQPQHVRSPDGIEQTEITVAGHARRQRRFLVEHVVDRGEHHEIVILDLELPAQVRVETRID